MLVFYLFFLGDDDYWSASESFTVESRSYANYPQEEVNSSGSGVAWQQRSDSPDPFDKMCIRDRY